MTSFIAELKKRLPESDWPVVVVALRNESQTWAELGDGDFAVRALSAAAADRAKWSPAFLGLLRLGQSEQFEALRETPMQPVAEKLRYEAAAAYESIAKQEHVPQENPRLAQAVLLALALRERRRMLSSWVQLANDLSIAPADFWKLPLACLLGLIPNQHELLQVLLSPEQSAEMHQLALHALVSNPLTLDVQTSHLIEITSSYELPQLMSLLRNLASTHPQLAQQLAVQTLEDLKETSAESCEGLTEIQRLLLQAEIYQISGQAERANPLLQAAWEAAHQLQAALAAKVAEASGDEAVVLAAVRESAELASPKIVTAGKAGIKRPGALLSAARVALRGEDPAEAKDLAIAALTAATKETRAVETREKVKLLCELGDLFMELDLPAEAEQAAKAAANMQGNSAESTALLSRILLLSAKPAEALQEAHLAVAFDPENMAVRRTLAQALELNGLTEEAFVEWTSVVGQAAEPAVDDLLSQASTAFGSDHIVETIEACQQVLVAEPANAAAYALMGQAVAAQGDDESAISYLQRATELSPAPLQPWLTLAELHLAKGSTPDALATLLSAQKYSEPSAKVHALTAGIYEEEARTEEALAAYQRASELATEQAATDIAQVVALKNSALLHRVGRTQPALDILEDAQLAFPENAKIARLFGGMLLQAGDAKRALALLQRAATVTPNDLDLLSDVAHAHAALGEHAEAEQALAAVLASTEEADEIRIELAEVLAAQGRHAEALGHFEIVLKGDLASEPSWNKRISLAKAVSLSASGKPVAALHSLEALDKQQPADREILRALCNAYQRTGRADEAADIAETVYSGDPSNEDTLLWYAETMQALDKSAIASKALRKTNGATLSPRVAMTLGKIQWAGDSPASALASFATLLQSDDATNIVEAGNFLLMHDAASESIPYYKRALELAGSSLPMLDGLTGAYLRLEQFEDALETIEESLRLAPNKAANLEIKAEILQRLGKPQNALQVVVKVLELVPNDEALLARKTDLLRQTEDWAGALAAALNALAQDPGHLTNLQTAAELAVLGLQPQRARSAFAEANITGIMSPGLASLHSELTLDAGEEIAAAKVFAAALEDLENDPRVLALQARLALCRGDRGYASQILGEALDAYKEHTDPLTSLAIGKAAEGLNQWDTAISLYSELAKAHPSLLAAQFQLGRALTLRAEWQQLCEASGATRDLPGAAALAKPARTAALHAFNAALEVGAEAAVQALISGWLTRAQLRFGESDLENLPTAFPTNAAEAAALAYALRLQEDAPSEAISGYAASPEVLVERALAGENELMAKAAFGLPHSAPVQALAAKFAQQAAQQAEALGFIQNALALWSGQPRWQVMAGEVQQQLGNLAEAADHFRQAAELEPEESKHFFALGQVQLARKSVAEAISNLQKAAELKPETGDYLVTLAQAQRQNGNGEQAKSIANQALRAAPGNTAAMLLQAQLALEENDGAKAKELAQQALTLTPKHVPALRIFAEALHLLGQSDEALAVLDRARATAEDEVPLLIRRAEIQSGEAGLRSLIKLSQKYPDRPEVFFALSQRLAQAGATQDAIQAAQHAVKKADALAEEKQTALHLHLARLLKQSGNLDQSLHHLDQAALIQPEEAESHLERGRVFIARRQYRPALKAFQQAAQLAPSAPEPHYEAGLALKEAKDYAAAESELRQAAHLAPKDRTIQRQLATVIALNLVHHQEAGVAL